MSMPSNYCRPSTCRQNPRLPLKNQYCQWSYTNGKTLPFLCGGVPANSKQYKKEVEDAKQQLAREDKNFHYIPLDSATFIGDQLHFDRPTAERLGQGMYNKMIDLKLIKGKKAE